MMFARHDEVHVKLRPGGEWATNDAGPKREKVHGRQYRMTLHGKEEMNDDELTIFELAR